MSERIPRDAIPAAVEGICHRLRKNGHHAWIVGGCVRDLLMGREVNDWDVATSARPEQVQGLFKKVIPTGIEHGTVTVLWKGAQYEVTTLRGEEGYSDGRRPDEVYFVDDIADDLARRDFTVNAIAYDPIDDRCVDPFDGLGDLDKGVLRAVGEPAERFLEDGLRVLRAARFAATLELELDPATEQAIPHALHVYRNVSHERVRDEWLKTMKAPSPSRAFEIMRTSGILEITCPVLMEQVGCAQNQFHAYDVWTHTMKCVDLCEGNEIERIAALLHDLGKPRTRELSNKTGDWTFYHHEKVGAKLADRWLREYRFSNADRETVVHLIRHHLVCYSREWTDAAVRRFLKRIGREHVDPLLRLARGDVQAKGRPVDDELADLEELRGRVDRVQREGTAFGTRDLAVSGHDVMERLGIAPGPGVGQVLNALLERVLEDPSLNERERLLDLVDQLGGELIQNGKRNAG